MNIVKRVERLENLIGIIEQDPPLLFIRVANNERGSMDPGTVRLGVIPGRPREKHGAFLIRNEGEGLDDFLERCDTRYSEVYDVS